MANNNKDNYEEGKETRSNKGNGSSGNTRLKNIAKSTIDYPYGTRMFSNRGNNVYLNDALPTLVTIDFQPMIGISNDATSPSYMAARSAYQVINVSNGRIPPYDPVMMELYFVSVGSFVMGTALAKRILAMAETFKRNDRSMPYVLLASAQTDWVDISDKLNDYITKLNLLIGKFNSTLAYPKNMAFADRWVDMCSHVFQDEDSEKCQNYMFRPVCLYKWMEGVVNEEEGEALPTYLRPLPLDFELQSNVTEADLYLNPRVSDSDGNNNIWVPVTGNGFTRLMSDLESMLNALLGSQDIAIMTADMYNASIEMSSLDMYESDKYELIVKSQDDWLPQIENMRVIPMAHYIKQAANIGENEIYNKGSVYFPLFKQATGINQGWVYSNYITENPMIIGTQISSAPFTDFSTNMTEELYGNKLLNFHEDKPSEESIFAALSLVPSVSTDGFAPAGYPVEDTAPYDIIVIQCGTELIVDVKIWWGLFGDSGEQPTYQYLHVPNFIGAKTSLSNYGTYISNNTNSAMEIRALAQLSSFHRHPEILYMDNSYWSSRGKNVVNRFWDLDTWSMMQNTKIADSHVYRQEIMYNILSGNAYSGKYNAKGRRNKK
jgi:hypothetical protein